MEAVLAVIVGIVFGSALAATVALPLRRRRRGSGNPRPERSRRLPFHQPAQRERAAFVAAGFALSATVANAAGWTTGAAILMLGAVMLGVQVATTAIVVRLRNR